MEMEQVFPLAPAVIKTGWLTLLFGGLLVLWIGMMVFLPWLIKSAANATVAVRGSELVVKGGVYGRTVPLEMVDVKGARRVAYSKDAPERLKWRTNGIALPGLQAGWFKLANGEKALLFITDQRRCVYVPTTLGYAIMVSPEDPEGFLRALGAR